VTDELSRKRYEQLVASHLDAAYNLARWLTQNPDDAHDCVQDACMRALRFFGGFRGGDGRAWLLTIVRNACYSFLQRRHAGGAVLEYDDECMSLVSQEPSNTDNPEVYALRETDARQLEAAIMALPPEYREALVLRELEDFSYKQIADIAGVPIGTVMSRLSRARELLRRRLGTEESP
jgi:RNA polymerase sigma-70 factor (ECF subfamily)